MDGSENHLSVGHHMSTAWDLYQQNPDYESIRDGMIDYYDYTLASEQDELDEFLSEHWAQLEAMTDG
jgi:uncharacterized protein Usg